jgi:hypothetical protein
MIHRYTGLASLAIWFLRACGAVAIVATAALGVLLLWNAPQSNQPTTAICLGIFAVIFGGVLGLLLINMFPDIRVNAEGLVIKFLGRPVKVSWNDLVDVRRLGIPLGHIYVVRARKVTSFHRLYGWVYTRSLLPAILVRDSIEDGAELLEKLRGRAKLED